MAVEPSVRELVEFIARSLVDYPDAVDVRVVERDRTLVVELRVAPADMGKVIGKQGRIANAIRALMKAAALRSGTRVMLDILQ